MAVARRPDAAERVAVAVDSLRHTYEAVQAAMTDAQRQQAEADYREFLSRCDNGRPPTSPATQLQRALRAAGSDTDAGAVAIRDEVADLYGWPRDDASLLRVQSCIRKHGRRATGLAAVELLREGRDERVRSPWAILATRAGEFAAELRR